LNKSCCDFKEYTSHFLVRLSLWEILPVRVCILHIQAQTCSTLVFI